MLTTVKLLTSICKSDVIKSESEVFSGKVVPINPGIVLEKCCGGIKVTSLTTGSGIFFGILHILVTCF